MSVINWSAAELGNVARYLAPGADTAIFTGMVVALAVVSEANVEEFIDTYSDRHGTPEPVSATAIRAAAPLVADKERAESTLRLLAYNANASTPDLKVRSQEALVAILTKALPGWS